MTAAPVIQDHRATTGDSNGDLRRREVSVKPAGNARLCPIDGIDPFYVERHILAAFDGDQAAAIIAAHGKVNEAASERKGGYGQEVLQKDMAPLLERRDAVASHISSPPTLPILILTKPLARSRYALIQAGAGLEAGVFG